ncbi:MAG: response regulator transcription factor [Clostridia bacterium]|nr:response regulator transcription factor [Clostridia bacterium]
MSKLRIAVLDDTQQELLELTAMLERSLNELEIPHEIESFQESGRFLENFTPRFDIIFLDVEMKPMDGMEVAKEIRLHDDQAVLIFATHYAKYAVSSYAVSAFDYLVKPIRYEDFCVKMRRVMRYLERNRGHYLYLRVNREIRKLNTDDIFYLEQRNHDLFYHMERETLKVKKTMKSAEEELAECHFLRCNACYLVNMRHITALKGDCFVVAGDSIPISRNRRKESLQTFAGYMGGKC